MGSLLRSFCRKQIYRTSLKHTHAHSFPCSPVNMTVSTVCGQDISSKGSNLCACFLSGGREGKEEKGSLFSFLRHLLSYQWGWTA